MTAIYRREEIERAARALDVVTAMEQAFVAYSRGEVVVPPVGELLFEDPPGDVHIKYGYVRGGKRFVVKIAAGFYRNRELGLASNSGLVLVFSQATGHPEAVLLDEGYLTDLRTAAAGAVAARHLAPRQIEAIGIFGSGTQARLQLELLSRVTDCRRVCVWSVNPVTVAGLAARWEQAGWEVSVMKCAADVAASANLLVTTTPAKTPFLHAGDIRPGTHITAVGSDTPEKRELDAEILAGADLVVADSIAQCRERGEIHHALQQGLIAPTAIRELGELIAEPSLLPADPDRVSIADLTGVAVQDIQIAEAVLAAIADSAASGDRS